MVVGSEKLKECHHDLQMLFNYVGKFVDIRIVEGHRGAERQDRLQAEGKSQLKFPDSCHNKMPSNAVDVIPEPVDWNDKDRFYHLGGIVRMAAFMLNIPLRWGGDWNNDFNLKNQTFFDFAHYELMEGN